jgi:hypothetical protein
MNCFIHVFLTKWQKHEMPLDTLTEVEQTWDEKIQHEGSPDSDFESEQKFPK